VSELAHALAAAGLVGPDGKPIAKKAACPQCGETKRAEGTFGRQIDRCAKCGYEFGVAT
jgi:uncharacterized protein (DUF983 family)